jgi:hypothetical protein
MKENKTKLELKIIGKKGLIASKDVFLHPGFIRRLEFTSTILVAPTFLVVLILQYNQNKDRLCCSVVPFGVASVILAVGTRGDDAQITYVVG